MRVCVYGAGAVGGHVAARLIAANAAEVSVVARGTALQAMRQSGLLLRFNGAGGPQEFRAKVDVSTDDPATLPAQDCVIVTLKAPALPGAAGAITRLLAPEGCAVFLTNGIPWWWPHGTGERGPLRLLDPGGELWSTLRERALGCVVYSSNEPAAPGVIVHSGADRWVMGEPDNTLSPRLARIVEVFTRAGMGAEATTHIRREIWMKLVSNATNNTLSALMRQPLANVSGEAGMQRVAVGLIHDTLAVGCALGYDIRAAVDVERLATRSNVKSGLRSSMLQDVLQGRPMEVEALLGQTQAYAQELKVKVPTIDIVLPLLRGLDAARLA